LGALIRSLRAQKDGKSLVCPLKRIKSSAGYCNAHVHYYFALAKTFLPKDGSVRGHIGPH